MRAEPSEDAYMTTEHGIADIRLTRGTDFSLQVRVSIPAEGILVLFGPSGCGKTTLLRCVAGLEHGQGVVQIGSKVWQDDARGVFVPTCERSLGYVFQEASLFSHLNVEKNLRFGLERTKDPEGDKRLEEAVELLGIRHLLARRVSQLSGGERQRCAIARALCLSPDVLLMDEPLAALDWARKREILPWIEKLREELRIPILYVTHSADEMTRLADDLVVMKNGRVAAAGPLADVLTNVKMPAETEWGPSSVLAAKVFEVVNAWQTQVVACGDWRFELARSPSDRCAPGDSVRLRVLARDVSIALVKPEESSIRNVLPAVVDALEHEPDTAYTLVRLRHPGNGSACLLARILTRSAALLRLQTGMPVWAQVKAAAMIG